MRFLPIIALIISVIALIFGGVFQNVWKVYFDRSVLQASVSDVDFVDADISQFELDIPADLVRRSQLARLFPTLNERETIETLETYVRNFESEDFSSAVVELVSFQSGFDESWDARQLRSAWANLTPNAKASVLASAGSDYIEELMPELMSSASPDKDPTLVMEEAYNVARSRFTNTVVFELENNPTISLVREFVLPHIAVLTAIHKNDEKIVSDVNRLVEEFKGGRGQGGQWVLTIELYNSGRSVASVYNFGYLIVSNFEANNFLIALEPRSDSGIGTVIPPGETRSIELVTFYTPTQEPEIQAISDGFQVGERRFSVVLRGADGQHIKTESRIFSAGLSAAEKLSLKEELGEFSFQR